MYTMYKYMYIYIYIFIVIGSCPGTQPAPAPTGTGRAAGRSTSSLLGCDYNFTNHDVKKNLKFKNNP